MLTRDELLQELQSRTGGRINDFVPGQWEAIEAACTRGRRTLVVQRTGWGKSLVYFGATLRLRREGAGPTLLISPLRALMRDQTRQAAELGLNACFMNSDNYDEWTNVKQALARDEVDILFITPEKLANDDFLDEYLLPFLDRIRLFVVDEAHCISDWGHEFRPDYQRIRRLVRDRLGADVSVLATTATANDRVIIDVVEQLGENAQSIRGPLSRESLRLQTVALPDREARYAWLAERLPVLNGSGIIYVLTQRDANRLAEWLRSQGILAEAYHSGVADEEGMPEGTRRRQLEGMLIRNELKVLVATNALSMGLDKPDLAFVIHFQMPKSIIQYYQEVGRAGRRLDQAYGVLLTGAEDESIIRFFIDNAFPADDDVRSVLGALEEADDGATLPQLETQVDLPKQRIEHILKYLAVRDEPPVTKDGGRWSRSVHGYTPDYEKMSAIKAVRESEWQGMKVYKESNDCLMQFLARALDDATAPRCGRCANCLGQPLLNPIPSPQAIQESIDFLRRTGYRTIASRAQWPSRLELEHHDWRGRINTPLEAGRVLSIWGDPGWAEMVAVGKAAKHFDDALVAASADLIRTRWNPQPAPQWVTCVPSRRTTMVPDFACRLAAELGLPFHEAVVKVKDTPQQKTMQNSWHQVKNLDGAFGVVGEQVHNGPCLLVDDMVDSRWSLTICGVLLREAGVAAVYPFALADTGKGS